MNRNAVIIWILFLVACRQEKSAIPLPQKQIINQPTSEQAFKRLYDIPELDNYYDSTQIVRLFTITKRYNQTIVIQINEFGNSISLCVKEPFFAVDENHPAKKLRMPFNQLCYSYDGKEAQQIKDWFEPFDNGRVVDSIQCKDCLDPEIWTVEVYNHGKYSLFVKDAYGENPLFVENLMKKVNLSKKNRYRIVY